MRINRTGKQIDNDIISFTNNLDSKKSTKEQYIFMLQGFKRYLVDNNLSYDSFMTKDYIEYIQDNSNNVKNTKFIIINKFFTYLQRKSIIGVNPLKRTGNEAPYFKVVAKQIDLPPDEVFTEALNTLRMPYNHIVEALILTTLRVSELLSIKVKDFKAMTSDNMIYVNDKTTDKKKIYLFPRVIELFNFYAKNKGEDELLFQYRHKKISRTTINYQLKKFKLTPHMCRHYGINLIACEVNMSQASKQAGHKKIEFTINKYGHINKSEMSKMDDIRLT